ncbi:MAG: GNAT family N-acetyltransferase [Chloroflexi bacterium]|nr:GNAT family N-acetyltransferase [Chloroflexota bacterium]
MDLYTYNETNMPGHVFWQIRSFYRLHWAHIVDPEIMHKPTLDRPGLHARHVVLMDQQVLASHATLVWKMLDIDGERYQVYGLAGVFTYPHYRKQGNGGIVVRECNRLMDEAGDGDLAMLQTEPHNISFYEGNDWTALPDAKLLVGDHPEQALPIVEVVVMRALSDKGRAVWPRLESTPFYFGDFMW